MKLTSSEPCVIHQVHHTPYTKGASAMAAVVDHVLAQGSMEAVF